MRNKKQTEVMKKNAKKETTEENKQEREIKKTWKRETENEYESR